MRRGRFVLLVVFFVMIPITLVHAQQAVPGIQIDNWFFGDLPSDYMRVEILGMCEMTYGGLGLAYLPQTSGLITINFYPGSAAGCVGPTIATFPIQYTVGEAYTIFIYPDTGGNRAFAVLNNDVSPVPRGKARLYIRNAYTAPSVDFIFQRQGHGPAITVTVPNGHQRVLDIAPGNWSIALNGVDLPVQAFRWDVPYRPGDCWEITTGGPVNEGVIGIWDFRYGG